MTLMPDASAIAGTAAETVGVRRVPGCPRATLRLQLTPAFGFDEALALLPYFERIGVSHLFVSPILTARRGSTHGYDVVDHRSVSAELGGEAGLRRLVDALRRRGMGLIADIVPNHMAVGGDDNPRWLDVLEWGRDSDSAGFFDIDWDHRDPTLRNRVLVPFLGRPYGEALAGGDLRLQFDLQRGSFYVGFAEHRFPVAAEHYAPLLAAAGLGGLAALFAPSAGPRSRLLRRQQFEIARATLIDAAVASEVQRAIAALLRDHDPALADGVRRLDRLLERQHYRLAWWRCAADEINWRRFFDVSSLAALRIQDPAVFEAVHETLFRLYRDGWIDGLRIDHVDGLADPRGYCRRLRARLRRLALQRPAAAPQGESYIVVEKILARGERLAPDWDVDGTSGYSFMSEAGALLHDPDGEAALGAMWTARGGRADFADEEVRARRRIPEELFSAEFRHCADALHAIARSDPRWRDWSPAAVRRVLGELLAHFPVYRTYADASGRSAADAQVMRQAVGAAVSRLRPGEQPLLALIDRWLGGEAPRGLRSAPARRARLRAIERFQHLTAPVAAKAVEDTAFYRHGRLLSRNEVGADPGQFSLPVADFHRISAERRQRYPRALLATATHDHKRGEDVRARLSMLSECPLEWSAAVEAWSALNRALRQQIDGALAPDDRDEYILYQMIVGCWPFDAAMPDLGAYAARLREWYRKALREARRHSSWIDPRSGYEDACDRFVEALLDPARSGAFLASVTRFVDAIAAAGAVKSLGQTLLRLTVPGVPDLYQGTEFWDLSMVDPDNRRAVDFDARRRSLAAQPSVDALLADWRSGAIKQQLIARTLALRAAEPALFDAGHYLPLEVEGPQAQRFIAFARSHRGAAALVVVPRLAAGLVAQPLPLLDAAALDGTRIVLPRRLRRLCWRSGLDDAGAGVGPAPSGATIMLSTLLARWPVGLLIGS